MAMHGEEGKRDAEARLSRLSGENGGYAITMSAWGIHVEGRTLDEVYRNVTRALDATLRARASGDTPAVSQSHPA